jgi:hypothetical protein
MFLHPGSDLEALSHLLPQPLAAFTSLNIAGARNPYAVLAARLSPAELPPPPRQRPARPPWCGQCDEITRMLGFYGDASRPCPGRKPWVAASRTARCDNGPSSHPLGFTFSAALIADTSSRLHGVDDGLAGPRTPACTGPTSWLRRKLRAAIRLVPGAPYAQAPVPGASMKNVIPSWKLC